MSPRLSMTLGCAAALLLAGLVDVVRSIDQRHLEERRLGLERNLASRPAARELAARIAEVRAEVEKLEGARRSVIARPGLSPATCTALLQLATERGAPIVRGRFGPDGAVLEGPVDSRVVDDLFAHLARRRDVGEASAEPLDGSTTRISVHWAAA